MPKTLILCDCAKSQPLSEKVFSRVDGIRCSRVHTALCTAESGAASKLIAKGDAIVACLQERAVFEELADELGVEAPDFVDIRDRAGWSDEADKSGPKMAALVRDALLPRPPGKAVDVASEGLCLIIGNADVAVPAAEQLCEILGVTVLLPEGGELPVSRAYDVTTGALRSVKGTLGDFEVKIDGLRQIEPGGRGDLRLGDAQDGAVSKCDIILDFTGGTPLFPAPEKRDGYLRADPRDPSAVAKQVFEASHMVGTFEKPLFLNYDENICAHSRAGKTGCTKCLDVCPTGAILPDGDHVAIDPMICAGCGACSALCPSGAISYDDPPVSYVFRRINTLVEAYQAAGGATPRLLVHDGEFGAEMISLSARFGRGLPADVIPMEVDALAGFGHAEMLAALATGFGSVHILLSPKSDRPVIAGETLLANTIAGKDRIVEIDVNDPDMLSEHLYGFEAFAGVKDTILPQGGRRDVTRLAAKALRPDTDAPIELPEGAPYGAVLVDTDACTLCLACASLCPSGALGDNPDMPQLRFQEDACLQCGLCANICPEKAITLKPQMDLSDAAYRQVVVHEEEPFACIECGALFGVKSTIERIAAQLEGKHSMFSASDSGKLIKMCDTCRIKAQYKSTDNPFQLGERPKTRTTDDYLKPRKDH